MELVLLVAGVALVAAGAWAVARRSADPGTTIDPFTVGEPWRHHVTAAQSAERRYRRIVADTEAGPLRDRLQAIGGQVSDAVGECFQIARRGHRLDDTIRTLDRGSLESRLAADPPADVRASLEAQLASLDRLRARRDDTEQRLRGLQTRLGELLTQAAEVSTGFDPTAELGPAVDDVVRQLTALRQAVDEIEAGP